MKKVAVAQEGHILMNEGRKGGKAAAKAYSQKHAPFGSENVLFHRQAVEETNEQGSQNVDRKSSVGERRKEHILHKPGKEESRDTTQKTACANDQ